MRFNNAEKFPSFNSEKKEDQKGNFISEEDFKNLSKEEKKEKLKDIRSHAKEISKCATSELKTTNDGIRTKKAQEKLNNLDQELSKTINNDSISSEQKISFLEEVENRLKTEIKYTEELLPAFKDNQQVKGFYERIINLKEKAEEKRSDEIIEASGKEIYRAWKVIKDKYPRLVNFIDIKLEDSGKIACFSKGSQWGSDPHIKMPGENSDFFKESSNKRKESIKVIAELLDKDYEKIIKEENYSTLKTFVFLHEIGHAHDFLNNFIKESKNIKDAREKWDNQRKKELNTLPVPSYNPTSLEEAFENNEIDWEKLDSSLQNKKVKEILKLQDKAYRKIRSERVPDNFAAEIINNDLDN